jgi:hypothetical protein
MIFVYNAYKEIDFIINILFLNKEYIYILNNMDIKQDFLSFLDSHDIKYIICNKIYSGLDELTKNTTCIDAENYKKDLIYTKDLALQCKLKTDCIVLLPENLGGDKYKNYDDFILNLGIETVIMERTYNVWKPWEIYKFWKRNEYLRNKGIKTVIGIWQDSLPWVCQKIQYLSAKVISNNNLMFYSE